MDWISIDPVNQRFSIFGLGYTSETIKLLNRWFLPRARQLNNSGGGELLVQWFHGLFESTREKPSV